MKVFFSLALIAGGLLMALFFAYDSYWLFFGIEGLEILGYLYLGSPIIFSLVVAFVGWRLYRSIPRTSSSDRLNIRSRTGLFLLLLGIAIAFSPIFAVFIRQLPERNLLLDGPDANSVELWLLMFTLPIGSLLAIFGLVFGSVQRSGDNATNPEEQPAQKDQPVANARLADKIQLPHQPRSASQVVLIVLAMFIGLNICFGAVTSFMGAALGLDPSWAIFGVFQLLAGGGIIFWGVRKLVKKKP